MQMFLSIFYLKFALFFIGLDVIMKLDSLIKHSASLYKIIVKSPQPSDKIASEYFRSKKYLGSKDRKIISELVFFTLRNKLLCEFSYSAFPVELAKMSKNVLSEFPDLPTIIFSLLLNQTILDQKIDFFSLFPESLFDSSIDFTSNIQTSIINLFDTTENLSKNWIDELINLIFVINNSFNNLNPNSPDYQQKFIEYLQIYKSFPEWIIKNLLISSKFSLESLHKLANAYLSPADVCIRFNHNLLSVSEISNGLAEEGIDTTKGLISPVCLRLTRRAQLAESQFFKNGSIEVQDEGSQLISFALGVDPKDKVLDACAGAGGKSLHIAALQNNQGTIVSSDTEFMRIKELSKRAQRAGLDSINTFILQKNIFKPLNNSKFRVLENSFDAVLVDAPCSGMGTLRRDPMKKYRTTERLVSKLAAKQLEILQYYSKFVKSGGVLVYATCSILAIENDDVVAKFLDNNSDFVPDALKSVFEKYDINIPFLDNEDFKLTLYPHLYKTDGFFMARMRKV